MTNKNLKTDTKKRMMESAEKDMKTAIINLFYILRDVKKNKHIEKYGRYKKELN